MTWQEALWKIVFGFCFGIGFSVAAWIVGRLAPK